MYLFMFLNEKKLFKVLLLIIDKKIIRSYIAINFVTIVEANTVIQVVKNPNMFIVFYYIL